MRQHYNPLEKQAKRLIPLAIAAIGGGISPLWAQTVDRLDTVVVTASRAQERVREISSNITVITEEEIKASPAATLGDILVQQGFFAVGYQDTQGVEIRGFGSPSMPEEHTNTVLILLNGRRTGNANVALAGLANVERIEIIRGPSAVQYGPSAMGGVINIITKRASGKPVISFEAGVGSDQLTREKLALSGAANGFDFALAATNYKRDDLTAKDGRRWYHTSIDHSTMANLDLGYTFNKNHRIGFNHNYGDISSVLSAGDSGIRPYSGNTPSAPYADYEKSTENTAFSYTGSTSDKVFDWSASYSFGSYDQKSVATAWWSKPTFDSKFFNAQAGYNGSIVSFSAGLDRYKYELDNKASYSSTSTKSSMEDIGVYATGKLRLLDERLIFSAGLRRDEYTNEHMSFPSEKTRHTGGSLGAAFLPEGWLKLRANYAEGFKMPSPPQIAGNGTNIIANSSLKPETSKTWELGADVDWNYVNASLTWFHSDWKNKIIGQLVPSCPVPDYLGRCSQNQNLKSSTLSGLEGSASVDLGKAFQWRYSLKPYVTFTWLETLKNDDRDQYFTYHGKPNSTLPNTPEWMVSYGVDYAHPAYKIKSRINANYYGEMYTRDWSLNGGPYIKRPTGTVVNWSLEKELADLSGPFGKLTLRTEINNLFDGANEMWWGYPGPGRSFYVGLRYDF
jgi:vitamin B12 transporter